MTRCACIKGRASAVPGAHAANFSHWKNADYDKIVDEVYITDPTKSQS